MKKFLERWYCEKGPRWCSEKLGANFDSVKQMANRMGLNYREARLARIRKHLFERLLIDGVEKTANDLGLQEVRIRLWAKKLGIKGLSDNRGAKPAKLTKEQEDAILLGYPAKSPWVIARETKLTGDVVLGFLQRRGLYQGFGRRASAVVNKDFFQWSNDFAYVFGYMCADGSIGEYRKRDSDKHRKRRLTYCSITSKDEQIVRDIGSRMGLTAKPYSYLGRTGKWIVGKYWRLSTSCRWVFDKWVEFGLMPRKSYLGIGVYDVSSKFVRHFIRGFFDGDGCRCLFNYRDERIGFGCTDKAFLEWIVEMITPVMGANSIHIGSDFNRKTTFYTFAICGAKARKLLEWMAPGESDLRLERKWGAFSA